MPEIPILHIRKQYSFKERRLREEAFTLDEQQFKDVFRMDKKTFEKFNREFGHLFESGMKLLRLLNYAAPYSYMYDWNN